MQKNAKKCKKDGCTPPMGHHYGPYEKICQKYAKTCKKYAKYADIKFICKIGKNMHPSLFWCQCEPRGADSDGAGVLTEALAPRPSLSGPEPELCDSRSDFNR